MQSLGLKTQARVKAARRLWGQQRYIDVVTSDEKSGKRLGVEYKFQATSGTAEEKIPATIQDMEHWPIPGIVVIDGEGFSKNMQGYLMSTGKVVWFSDLEDWLRLYFGL
ncbi:PD-(D/E)XK nuclease superfamily protein [Synechococcus sp. OH2]|uniref:PD-(D/E)XK nuclease superfamily protein n=1 Tax=Synechococcus sp. OH2 TaxID=136798 RepID=UPI0039C47C15